MQRISPFALALILSLSGVQLAKADQPGVDWMPAQQVIGSLLKSGYTQIWKIEADDGRWEGKGVKDGKTMKFHADPKTGVITSEKPDK
jgi:hypothetical protein